MLACESCAVPSVSRCAPGDIWFACDGRHQPAFTRESYLGKEPFLKIIFSHKVHLHTSNAFTRPNEPIYISIWVYKGAWGLWGGRYSLVDKIRKVLFDGIIWWRCWMRPGVFFVTMWSLKGSYKKSNKVFFKICIESYKGGRMRSVFDQSTMLQNSEKSVINCSTNFYEIEFIKSFKNAYSGYWSSWIEALPGAKGLRTQALLLMFN